jgi:hypothetical protein
MMLRRAVIGAAVLLLTLSACSYDELIGTASRTLRNVCAQAPNCTTYDENGERNKELDPFDTKRQR